MNRRREPAGTRSGGRFTETVNTEPDVTFELADECATPNISPTAIVASTTYLDPTVTIDEQAHIADSARITDYAHISGAATISGYAHVGGAALIAGDTTVTGDAIIRDVEIHSGLIDDTAFILGQDDLRQVHRDGVTYSRFPTLTSIRYTTTDQTNVIPDDIREALDS